MAPGILTHGHGEGPSSPDYSPTDSTSSIPNSEPIAICGFSCRLPGDSSTPQKFWDLLANGRSGQCDIPKDRFNIDGFYHPRGVDRPGSVVTRGGYFIAEEIRNFENSFFGINNLEATYMDPQQRKLLEVVFECLENAGVPLDEASGSNTGCFVGNFTFDYTSMQVREPDYMSRYSATGLGPTILANRISHVFNLLGPSFVLDTACSSSLYCLHTACVALENYECDAAIVAGSNLIQSAEQHIATMKVGVLSPTSTCHTFDSSADGYGRGDGIGALYVKRLKDALRDGDPIRSVVRSSAINANGKTAGISLPSADGQEAVIRKAMAKGGVRPEDITYVECHGTGTKVGDAIEVDALSRVFKRSAKHPLIIGSVKSNIGHSEAASGIAGVIKSTLTLERGQIPAVHGLKNINPKLKAEGRHFSIPKELTPWPNTCPSGLRRIGINSFGYGGANSHVILEAAPTRPLYPEARKLIVHQSSVLLPLSAATTASLEARVNDFSEFDFGQTDILDLAYTLGTRRTHFPVRGFLVAPRSEPISQSFKTQKFITGAEPANTASSPFAFVFTGQGSQWPGMCRELFLEFPIFRDVITEMDSVLKSLPHPPEWSLRDAILETGVGLVRLLASWGITPSTAVGHSSGEIGAAFSAGHISAAEAIVIAYYRGYCVSKAAQQDGAMMAAGLSEAIANEEISKNELQGKVTVACINSPEGVTISGDRPAIDSLFDALHAQGTFVRKLKTGGQAYHSQHMLAIGDEYQSLLDKILPTVDPSTKMRKGATVMSSVTASPKSSGFDDARYWRANLEGQVRFSQAIDAIHRISAHCFVELGPHSSLELPIKQTLAKVGVAHNQVKYAAPIKRNTNALESALTFAGSLWLQGLNINWSKVNGLDTSLKSSHALCRVVTDLPKYRFDYQEILWTECRASIEYRQRKYLRHELLGSLIPGGNGKDFIFRNLLRLDDVSWLRDHKHGEAVVFPAAGYLAMATEAIAQITDADKSLRPSFHFSNVNFADRLLLSTEVSAQAEVFTTLYKSAITKTTTSETWWDFSISSYAQDKSITHATGAIAIVKETTSSLEPRYKPTNNDSLETSAKRTWFEKFARQGLDYGPAFQSITEFQTPRMKTRMISGAIAPLLTEHGDDPSSVYAVHPVTLETMTQLAIVASTKGVPKQLKASTPARIASAVINTSAPHAGENCQMHSVVTQTGFGYFDGGVEIVTKDGRIAAQFNHLRLVPLRAAEEEEEEEDRRHPVLRVLWKPDVYGLGLLDNKDAEEYVQRFAGEAACFALDDGLIKMRGMLDLLAHKNPMLSILELGNDSPHFTISTLDLLASQTDFKRLSSYTTASLTEDGRLIGSSIDLATRERLAEPSELEGKFDLILIPDFGELPDGSLEKVRTLSSENGSILSLVPGAISSCLVSLRFPCLSFPVSKGQSSLVFARQPLKSNQEALWKHKFLIVEKEKTRLGSALQDALSPIQGQWVMRVKLCDLTPEHVSKGTTVFSLCEAKNPLLSVISDEDMKRVKMMTDGAASLVWVTNGNIMRGDRPDFALIAGLARSLILEQPSLNICTYDIDDSEDNVKATAQNLVSVLNQPKGQPDLEFAQHKGVVHVSRFAPDTGINATFRSKQGLETTPISLKEADDARLVIGQAGQFDTIFFKQQEPPTSIAPTEVRIKVASVGLNARDYDVLAGQVDAPNATCQLECAGTIVQVGSSVTDFTVGDRVVAMAPTHFQTYQTLPQWACHKLADEEKFDVCSTLPLSYATAIYALHHRANIQPGESILIHSGAGGVGMAAIQLAQQTGAEIFTTVSTEEKRHFLINKFGLDPSNIFSSLGTSFLDDILKATGGRGVDVIINSLKGDQLHATWKCAAEFGRFVEIGNADSAAAGRLEMDQFLKNTTFTAFDISKLYHSKHEQHHSLWKKLLSQVMTLYREHKIIALEPLKIFDVAETPEAFRSVSDRSRIGKIAINLENPASTIKAHKLKHTTRFDSDKSYVMVGCLGGLGRTLSRWMVSRGARKFAFLGRSGIAKAAARNLVEDLESSGATCVVVKGDVCSSQDVEAVTAAAARLGAVGGVVQAAMGLNEAIFSNMSNKYWHTGIDPKVHGTWHLYNSLRANGHDSTLDFFLMTSSVSGSVGTATESNYCAGNHFLDHFARFMRSQGLPAVSIGFGMISEVGYLHDNPEIEAILLRKGIQAIDADELIQLTDLALSSSSAGVGIDHAHDHLAAAHLLTGLEAFGLKELRKKGFDGNLPALDDPRANLLASALDAKLMEAGKTLPQAVQDHIRRRFGNLVLMKFEAVDVKKPLAAYGMDSMIGAEFRSWFYQSMKVDVPLAMLLGKTSTLETLGEVAVAALEGA
ncbi:Highly reducing polyketide synthase srdA [Cladobotryum mycophilum]|uniref:Highly reducing polyketide synthase srdA n=1 Tax=Cladobotryum mycophilum TaxID=491253 RepID=A0ABR0SXL7_9HYPO